jgi:hypothetical protein
LGTEVPGAVAAGGSKADFVLGGLFPINSPAVYIGFFKDFFNTCPLLNHQKVICGERKVREPDS